MLWIGALVTWLSTSLLYLLIDDTALLKMSNLTLSAFVCIILGFAFWTLNQRKKGTLPKLFSKSADTAIVPKSFSIFTFLIIFSLTILVPWWCITAPGIVRNIMESVIDYFHLSASDPFHSSFPLFNSVVLHTLMLYFISYSAMSYCFKPHDHHCHISISFFKELPLCIPYLIGFGIFYIYLLNFVCDYFSPFEIYAFDKQVFIPASFAMILGSAITTCSLLYVGYKKNTIDAKTILLLLSAFLALCSLPFIFNYCYDERLGNLLMRVSVVFGLYSFLVYTLLSVRQVQKGLSVNKSSLIGVVHAV